jgi:hypothetical protein
MLFLAEEIPERAKIHFLRTSRKLSSLLELWGEPVYVKYHRNRFKKNSHFGRKLIGTILMFKIYDNFDQKDIHIINYILHSLMDNF